MAEHLSNSSHWPGMFDRLPGINHNLIWPVLTAPGERRANRANSGVFRHGYAFLVNVGGFGRPLFLLLLLLLELGYMSRFIEICFNLMV